jgi:hypothetical protein
MNIQQAIVRLLQEKTSDAITKTATSMATVVIKPRDNDEISEVLESLKRNMSAINHRESVATIAALMLWNADDACARVRRLGLLRASRYRYNSGCAKRVVDAALRLAPVLGASANTVTYFSSVAALLSVAGAARQVHDGMLSRLRSRSSNALKTLLVAVNTAFAKGWSGDRRADSNTLNHWSIEDLASAFSLLLDALNKEARINDRMWQRTDELFAEPLEVVYWNLLVDACKLNALREAETMIDGLPFTASRSGEKDVIVSGSSPELEKSIRLGFIQAALQMQIRARFLAGERERENWQVPTIQEFVEAHFDAGLHQFAAFVTEPIKRLVLILPMNLPIFEQLAADAPFLDEIVMMHGASVDSFQPELGPDLQVTESLTALDILKVQRVFRVIEIVFDRKLSTIKCSLERERLRARSTILLMSRNQLLSIVRAVVSQEKAEELIRYLTLAELEQFIDIQYRPFISAGDFYVVAPAIMSKSNLLRNIVVENRIKNPKTTEDFLEKTISDALLNAGFLVRSGFNFDISGKRETDIFAWKDNELFIFECKNSYHPCSAHELRTSFEQIRTAQRQLDKRISWLRTTLNQEKLFSAIGWSVPTTINLHSAIITGNRAFSGHMMGVHPVRQAHELINVLTRGEVLRVGAEDSVKFWKGDEFQTSDLIEYLKGGTIVQLQMAALTPYDRTVQIGAATLIFNSYFMDMDDADRLLKEMFGDSELNKGDVV